MRNRQRPDFGFRRYDPADQRILLRALEQMDQDNETPDESARITSMTNELDALLNARRRFKRRKVS